jgi:hypothetical protein
VAMDEALGPTDAVQERGPGRCSNQYQDQVKQAVDVKIQTPAPDRLRIVFSQPPSRSMVSRTPLHYHTLGPVARYRLMEVVSTTAKLFVVCVTGK